MVDSIVVIINYVDKGCPVSRFRGLTDEYLMPIDYSEPDSPAPFKVDRKGDIGILCLAYGGKDDAIDEQTIVSIETYFNNLTLGIKAVVLANAAAHFPAGLGHNVSIMPISRNSIKQSHLWQRVFNSIQYGSVPVVAVLRGAVVGAGLGLAAAAHVRVAEHSAFYSLSEEIPLDRDTTSRLVRLIGAAWVMDMMLTGRRLSAEEGQAIGLSTYLVGHGMGFEKGIEVAARVANIIM